MNPSSLSCSSNFPIMVAGARKGTTKAPRATAVSPPMTPVTRKLKRPKNTPPSTATEPGVILLSSDQTPVLTEEIPPRKKIKSSAGVVTIDAPPWVPPQMKIDLMSLHNAKSTTRTKIETLACLRFYVRVIMVQKRNITAADRIDFAVCFGVSKDDAAAYEAGINCGGDGEKPWGVLIAERLKNYYHGLMAKLRENFDLLLIMFWNSESTKPWIRGQMIMVEAAKQAALLDGRQGMKRKLKCGGTGETPIIDEEDVDELFLKGNMKLVSDVWYHILDVVERELLLKDEEWGKRMLSSTCTILAWYITYLFQLPDPKGFMEGTVTSGGIEASDRTKAIHKGDLQISQLWPGLRVPLRWGKRRNSVPWYGELVGGRGLQDSVLEDLEVELAVAGVAEMTAAGMNIDEGKKVDYPWKVLEDGIDVEAERLKKLLLSRSGLLEDLARKAQDKAKEAREKAMEMVRGMKLSRIYIENLVKQRMATEAIEQFCKSAWVAYEEAKRGEKQAEFEGNGSGAEVLEVIGGFHVWMENIKKMGIFKDLGIEYEQSFGAPVSRSVMQVGNSSGISQATDSPFGNSA